MINLFKPYIPKDVREAVYDALGEQCVTQGPKVEEFEREICKKFFRQNALTLNSGTSALELAYELIDIKPGDEVITTPLTCTATNLPLLRMGAKLVWADIRKDTLCIDREDVLRKITDKTKAVVQVHLGGVEADVGKLARDDQGLPKHIPVVSDACQAFGIFNGDYTCCSFQAIKHITTVDGGLLSCVYREDHEKAKLLRWFGIDRNKKMPNSPMHYKERMMTYDIEFPGSKKHMNDVSAAMGLASLKHYDTIVQHRAELGSLYLGLLGNMTSTQFVGGNHKNVWGNLTLLVERRDDFAKKMFEAGIDCHIVQSRNDTYKVFGGKKADLPVMNEIEDKYICLPIGMHVSKEDVYYICDTIKKGW